MGSRFRPRSRLEPNEGPPWRHFIPWLAAMHEGKPSTFKIRFLGKRQIYTTDTENLKAMTAINWKDFGISPLRRSTKAFHPFADKGVNTVDGDNWVCSRFLIKPFFNHDVYTNTDRIRPYVDSLFTLLPPDGETFNIQPLLQRWFLDLTTGFILGEPMGALHQADKAKITWAMLDVLRGSRQLMQVVRMIKWLFNEIFCLNASTLGRSQVDKGSAEPKPLEERTVKGSSSATPTQMCISE